MGLYISDIENTRNEKVPIKNINSNVLRRRKYLNNATNIQTPFETNKTNVNTQNYSSSRTSCKMCVQNNRQNVINNQNQITQRNENSRTLQSNYRSSTNQNYGSINNISSNKILRNSVQSNNPINKIMTRGLNSTNHSNNPIETRNIINSLHSDSTIQPKSNDIISNRQNINVQNYKKIQTQVPKVSLNNYIKNNADLDVTTEQIFKLNTTEKQVNSNEQQIIRDLYTNKYDLNKNINKKNVPSYFGNNVMNTNSLVQSESIQTRLNDDIENAGKYSFETVETTKRINNTNIPNLIEPIKILDQGVLKTNNTTNIESNIIEPINNINENTIDQIKSNIATINVFSNVNDEDNKSYSSVK